MKKILSTRVLVKIGVLTTILLVLIICTVWGNSALMVSTVNISSDRMYAAVLIWFYVVTHTEGSFDCLLLGGLLPPIKGCFLNMIPVFIQTERQIWLLAAALEIVLFHSDLIIVQRLY